MITRDGNNEETFKQFVIDKLLDFPIEQDNAVVVLDLAKYHGCQSVIKPLLEAGLSVIFLPPSSSNLNPIEKLWSILKNNLSKRRAMYSSSDINLLLKYDMLLEAH
jgi:transposase